MDKKIIFKIVVIIFSASILILGVLQAVNNFPGAIHLIESSKKLVETHGESSLTESYMSQGLNTLITISCVISTSLFWLVLCLFKDISFITESLIKMFKETGDKRKENKKKHLAKDIEKKQALLNEMQKDEE